MVDLYENNDVIDEIESEGMLEVYSNKWVPITTRVEVKKETEKAYFGDIHVDDETGEVYNESDTWVPKSMAENVWWICVVKFGHERKVANKRFEAW